MACHDGRGGGVPWPHVIEATPSGRLLPIIPRRSSFTSHLSSLQLILHSIDLFTSITMTAVSLSDGEHSPTRAQYPHLLT